MRICKKCKGRFENGIYICPDCGFVINGSPRSLTRLLDQYDLSIDAASIYKALVKAGIVSVMEYESTSGSGEIKYYKKIGQDWLKYGENKSVDHPFRTEARFYPTMFPRLMALVVDQLKEESIELNQKPILEDQ